jgi:hypothetical protein
LNYLANQTLANAAIVPAGTSGGVTVVAGVSGTDLIIDINGYYASAATDQEQTFTVINNASAGSAILGQSNSQNFNTTGVKGVAFNAIGATNGVWGQNLSSSNLATGVFGTAEATSGATVGVWGRTLSSSAGAIGVYGEALATTGRIYGVYGFEASNAANSAGVRGVDYTGSPGGIPAISPAGVRGESKSNIGVFGVSQNAGIVGYRVNSSGFITSAGYLGDFSGVGVYYLNGLAGTGTKSFVEPHPTDATKLIKYVSIEGPEAGVYFRGRGHAHKGLATIDVPEDFRMVAAEEGLSIQVTPIGEMANVAVLQIDLNRVVVKATRDVEFFYTVNGVRRAYPTWNPIQENRREFVPEGPDARLPAYLSANETQRLIDNGTYNADGTVNMRTAEHAGWVKAWADRAAEAQAAAQEAQKAARARRE